jgi:hypothetical protein
MSDLIATGIFTLAGAAIGAVGTQISRIIRDTSKSRARKQKAEQKRRDAAAAARRPLYTQFLKELQTAAETVNWILQADAPSPRAISQFARNTLRQQLAEVFASAVAVQIDGSPGALDVATKVLTDVAPLESIARLGEPVPNESLNRASSTLRTAEAAMIELSRKDFGAEAG